jgi:ATPase subunit of ABC transporter with duplicated ATPase domains
MLAGIAIHLPELLLLDEPSNHLDGAGRALLHELIECFSGTMVVVGHDRALLDRCTSVHLLRPNGIQVYGGNFSFYEAQRAIEQQALTEAMHAQEKTLRQARQVARESAQRQQKLDARGKRKQQKAGVPKIMLNTLRDQAQQSTAKLRSVHADRIAGTAEALHNSREALGQEAWMRFGFGTSTVNAGKVLVKADGVNILRTGRNLWAQDLDLHIRSGERIAVSGRNGSGKTTLLRLVTGAVEPSIGTLHRAIGRAVYVDQHYSLIHGAATVLQHAQRAAAPGTAEHVIKTRLDHFLFPPAQWHKPSHGLSGGERLRLTLCGLTLAEQAPDLLVLDEPTNNLDLRNMDMLVQAVAGFNGTLLVVSHDTRFLEEVGLERTIRLS